MENTENEEKDLTLELINERLDSIEEKFELESKSVIKKMGSWGGIIALIVSVFVGGIEIHDKTIGKRERNDIAEQQQISENIEKLSRYNQEISTLSASGNFLELNFRGPQINAEKLRLVREIESASPKVKSQLDSVALLSLSHENANIRDYEKAEKYANEALTKADSLMLKVESMRYSALAISPPSPVSDKDKAREILTEALNLLDDKSDLSLIHISEPTRPY